MRHFECFHTTWQTTMTSTGTTLDWYTAAAIVDRFPLSRGQRLMLVTRMWLLTCVPWPIAMTCLFVAKDKLIYNMISKPSNMLQYWPTTFRTDSCCSLSIMQPICKLHNIGKCIISSMWMHKTFLAQNWKWFMRHKTDKKDWTILPIR